MWEIILQLLLCFPTLWLKTTVPESFYILALCATTLGIINRQCNRKKTWKFISPFFWTTSRNINVVCGSSSWRKKQGCFWWVTMTKNFGFTWSDSHFLCDFDKVTSCNVSRNGCCSLRLSFYFSSPEYLAVLHVLPIGKLNVSGDFMESLDLDPFRASELLAVTYIWHDFLARSRTPPTKL